MNDLKEDTWYWVSGNKEHWFPAKYSHQYAGNWTNEDTWEDFDRNIKYWVEILPPQTRVLDSWTDKNGLKPIDEGEVLVCLKGKEVTTGHYFKNGDIWRVGGEYTDEVTHWMRLPKPPEVGG